MPGDPVRSYEIILPLLQLIALTLPVVAILTQVMVRGVIIERDDAPSWYGKFAFAAIGFTTIYLMTAAINLTTELGRLVEQSAITNATNSIVAAFGGLTAAIIFGLYELWDPEPADEGESTKTPGNQSRLEDFGESEE